MINIYISQNKTLCFATVEDANKFADVVKKKTGQRPELRAARNDAKKSGVLQYCRIKPDYSRKTNTQPSK